LSQKTGYAVTFTSYETKLNTKKYPTAVNLSIFYSPILVQHSTA